jgi:tetratricopeptide (TPR) repeat protein
MVSAVLIVTLVTAKRNRSVFIMNANSSRDYGGAAMVSVLANFSSSFGLILLGSLLTMVFASRSDASENSRFPELITAVKPGAVHVFLSKGHSFLSKDRQTSHSLACYMTGDSGEIIDLGGLCVPSESHQPASRIPADQVLYESAMSQLYSGQLELSVDNLSAAIGINPHDYRYYAARAEAYMMLGDYAEGRNDYASAIATLRKYGNERDAGLIESFESILGVVRNFD